MVVLGSMTLGGVINPVQDLAASLQLAFDSGAKRSFADVFRGRYPDSASRVVYQIPVSFTLNL